MGAALLAAHILDPVTHTQSMNGLVAGVVGGALFGALVLATGGTALIVAATVVGAAAAGGGIGMVLGSLSGTATVVGNIATGSPDTMWDGRKAARANYGGGDYADCKGMPFLFFHLPGHGAKYIATGAATVLVNGQPAARDTDVLECSALIKVESGTVLIGGPGVQVMAIEAEVPGWIGTTLMVVGLASALVLASPVVVVCGLVGGIFGQFAGEEIAMRLFPGNSDAQKIGGLLGSLAGGFFGAKGGEQANGWLWGQRWYTNLPWNQGQAGSFMRAGGQGLEAYSQAQTFLNEKLPTLDFKIQAGPDGVTPDGAGWFGGEPAMNAAQNGGYTTLNQTPGGAEVVKFTTEIGGKVPWDVQRAIWAEASSQYVEGVVDMHLPGGAYEGQPINVFGNGPPGSQTIFVTTEQPIITNAGIPIQQNPVPLP